ncbi:uncharacterized protein K441DRAFT_315088 [Cenococcum geophilum 1.58]|uniref:Uncharacterized protein n=1 Tax=Cenococcum geophilum 1.58 TaxID=794803 RepID=A0ACC8EPU5_9PEZI|nr:hypothetical protein K441DRAFT_315088 [Cenococcum geophilum 1.58]
MCIFKYSSASSYALLNSPNPTIIYSCSRMRVSSLSRESTRLVWICNSLATAMKSTENVSVGLAFNFSSALAIWDFRSSIGSIPFSTV